METLSNFSSIYCFITFVIGAVFMLTMLSIAAMCKVKEPRNNVRFFVEKEVFNGYFLYIGNKDVMCYICSNDFFKKFGLNTDDFADMKEGQIREVFLTLED